MECAPKRNFVRLNFKNYIYLESILSIFKIIIANLLIGRWRRAHETKAHAVEELTKLMSTCM